MAEISQVPHDVSPHRQRIIVADSSFFSGTCCKKTCKRVPTPHLPPRRPLCLWQHHLVTDMMVTEGLQQSVVAYNALISGCTTRRDSFRAMCYARDMVSLLPVAM